MQMYMYACNISAIECCYNVVEVDQYQSNNSYYHTQHQTQSQSAHITTTSSEKSSPSKRAAALLTSLRKSLSPSGGSARMSPGKSKSRPATLAIRKSSPRCVDRQASHQVISKSAIEEARHRLLRSNSTPAAHMTPSKRRGEALSERDRALLTAAPLCIDATSPDYVVVTPQLAQHRKDSQPYSPSNYAETNSKPDKDKKFESPFQKLRRKSSKSLLKRLLGGAPPPSPDSNTDSVNLGYGQTLQLCDRNPLLDTNSQLSVDAAVSDHVREVPQTPKVSNTATSASSVECSHCNSISSLITDNADTAAAGGDMRSTRTSPSRVIPSKEMQAIEAGLKVFDATSPDHCVVVDRGSPRQSPLDRTLCYEVCV